MQDFPRRGCQPLGSGQKAIIGKIFAEKSMKTKEIGRGGGGGGGGAERVNSAPPLDPPMVRFEVGIFRSRLNIYVLWNLNV